MRRGYLVDGGDLTESIVRRMSERRRVLANEGELCESRLDGESRSIEGIGPGIEKAEWS